MTVVSGQASSHASTGPTDSLTVVKRARASPQRQHGVSRPRPAAVSRRRRRSMARWSTAVASNGSTRRALHARQQRNPSGGRILRRRRGPAAAEHGQHSGGVPVDYRGDEDVWEERCVTLDVCVATAWTEKQHSDGNQRRRARP